VKTTSVNYTYKDLKSEYFDLKCFRQNAYCGEPETSRDWIGGIGLDAVINYSHAKQMCGNRFSSNDQR
jgi:hypothetical protein